jgi:hypothetical protein
MHQSPQKYFAGRREKYADSELTDMQAERRLHRESQPKARKFSPRDEPVREPRSERQFSYR